MYEDNYNHSHNHTYNYNCNSIATCMYVKTVVLLVVRVDGVLLVFLIAARWCSVGVLNCSCKNETYEETLTINKHCYLQNTI